MTTIRRGTYLRVTNVRWKSNGEADVTLNDYFHIFCPAHQAPRIGQMIDVEFSWDLTDPLGSDYAPVIDIEVARRRRAG